MVHLLDTFNSLLPLGNELGRKGRTVVLG